MEHESIKIGNNQSQVIDNQTHFISNNKTLFTTKLIPMEAIKYTLASNINDWHWPQCLHLDQTFGHINVAF